ncbi:MAG TPA: ATP-binding protein [Anaerolineae bacterium]|nr:ATP-binding protein [Anaerolineae bacterium]
MGKLMRILNWSLVTPYLVLTGLALLGITLFFSDFMADFYIETTQTHMLLEAKHIATHLEPVLVELEDGEGVLTNLTTVWLDTLSVYMSIIDLNGNVIVATPLGSDAYGNEASQPEIQALLVGQADFGQVVRVSRPAGLEMMHTVVPLTTNSGERIGLLRIALPLTAFQHELGQLRLWILAMSSAIFVVVAILVLLVSHRSSSALLSLNEVAANLGDGNLDARYYRASPGDIGQLAGTFNRMADQIRQQVIGLVDEQKKLVAMLNHMADAIILTDEVGLVQRMNPAGEAILQVKEANMLEQPITQALRHHQLIALWQACRADEAEQIAVVELEAQGLFLQAIMTPVPTPGKLSYLIILQDLTQIRRLETVRRDFISNISHELRTPLASLQAVVETLQDGALEDPVMAHRFLNRAADEVDTLTQMVLELLELARIESGKVPLRLAATHISHVILQVTERLGEQAERANITLEIDVADRLPLVLIDAERIKQVITNLTHNALKFTSAQGRVTVGARQKGDMVLVWVADTGVGIPKEEQGRIFERFYKADRARTSGGTGLGLAIVRHLVNIHRGQIWVESKLGEGSTFYFTVPISAL